jgi:hypothetical protein
LPVHPAMDGKPITRKEVAAMSRSVCLGLCLVALLGLLSYGPKKEMYPCRWVYVTSSLGDDSQMQRVKDIAKVAAEHGINGILFSAGMDEIDLRGPEYIQRLKEVNDYCKNLGVEIIPGLFSIGYGGSLMAHNKNLSEGLPVKNALFQVKGGQAVLIPDPPVKVVNGSFEKYDDNQVDGFSFSGKLGEVIFVDKEIVKEGKASLRLENLESRAEDAGRLSQEIAVAPYRCYSLSCWFKTEGVDPSKPFSSGNLRLRALGPDGRQLLWTNVNAPASGDWFKTELGFNSLNYDKVVLSVGVEEAQKGKIWIDDLRVEEVGLVNVLRRPGTPLTVAGDKDGAVFEEGRDYETVADPDLNFRFDHQGPAIKLAAGSRIKEGAKLRVSWYHGITVYDGQVTVCMSEPQVYDIWRTQTKMIQETLAPKKFFLHMDEMRAGGTCEACLNRGLPMAQILGDCITRTAGIIREANPQAEIFIWSDMLDPNHNASNRQNYYYHTNENFYGSWNYVPKDLVIACWYYEKRKESLAHFSSLGFRTLAGAYYDADDLENPKGWLEDLDKTPGAVGIMYTTWLDKYALLPDFGDLVSQPRVLIPLPVK